MLDFRATKKYRGEVAARYDEKRAVKDVTRRDQAIVENYLCKIAPGSSVLDISAGTGRFIQFCLNRGCAIPASGSHLKEYTYKFTGGTGKFQGASGGGTYLYENITDTLAGGTYKGKLVLP
jgi:hypothetical protein